MLRPCGIHPGAARPWLVSIFGTTLCWAAALGRQLAAALLAAQAVLAAGEGPYSVVPEDYNLEELPTPSAPNGDAVELEVGVDSRGLRHSADPRERAFLVGDFAGTPRGLREAISGSLASLQGLP